MSRFPLLSNAQWELIAGLLAARSGRQGRPFSGARSMVEGTGVPVPVPTPWRDLPAVFGRWQRAWTWPRREAEDGTRDLIFAKLTAAGDAVGPGGLVRAGGLDGRPAARTSTPRIPTAIWGFVQWQNLLVERPEHAAGRSRGGLRAKIHQLVLGAGLPLVAVCAPGHSGDCPIRLLLLDQLRVRPLSGRPRTRAGALRGDKAYCERAIRQHLRRREIKAVIAEPANQIGHRKRRGTRGGRPPAYDDADDQGPQRRQAPLVPPGAMASTGHRLRQARYRLLRRNRPGRHHRLDQSIIRHP